MNESIQVARAQDLLSSPLSAERFPHIQSVIGHSEALNAFRYWSNDGVVSLDQEALPSFRQLPSVHFRHTGLVGWDQALRLYLSSEEIEDQPIIDSLCVQTLEVVDMVATCRNIQRNNFDIIVSNVWGRADRVHDHPGDVFGIRSFDAPGSVVYRLDNLKVSPGSGQADGIVGTSMPLLVPAGAILLGRGRNVSQLFGQDIPEEHTLRGLWHRRPGVSDMKQSESHYGANQLYADNPIAGRLVIIVSDR